MLRKGPDSVPASMFVFAFAIGLLLLSFILSAALAPVTGNDDAGISFLIAVMSYVLYWMVLATTGYSHRLLPTISSIMACGSLLSVARAAAVAVMSPLASADMTAIVAGLIFFWSIPVKGHIIARAIGRHWYIGIAIAMTIFIMQNVAYLAMTTPASN
jgi:hypothetical protein